MGTNYYLRSGICSGCGRYDETHICKSYSTWHAPRVWDEDLGEMRVTIAHWQAWKRYLRDEVASGGRIFDEYGKKVDLHVFISRAETNGPDPERRQYTWTKDAGHPVAAIESGSTWVDAEGFTFYAGEFS